MPGLNSSIEIRYERRLCTVNSRLGYFHTGVERVYPTSIKFCDKENADLAVMQKVMEERDKNG